MSAKVLWKVVCGAGQYPDKETGQMKTRWHNCGVIMQLDSGRVTLKLDSLPVNMPPNENGDAGLWLQCFEPSRPDSPRQGAAQPRDGFNQQVAPNQMPPQAPQQGFREQPAPAQPQYQQPQQGAAQGAPSPVANFDDLDVPF